MTEFGTAFGRQNAPKSLQTGPPEPLKKHRNCDAVFDRVFDPILYRILLVSIAARPTIWLLFTAFSWGAAFFAKLEKD